MLRWDSDFNTAKAQLESVLSDGVISLRDDSLKVNVGVITSFDICGISDLYNAKNDFSNMSVLISFDLSVPNETINKVEKISQQLDLLFLTTVSDLGWSRLMKFKVWNDCYPTTVGISFSTKSIYLIFLHNQCLQLQKFCDLTSTDLDLLKNLNLQCPYKIDISKEALWAYVSEEEGSNYLKQNLEIYFDCGQPLMLPLKK